MAASPPAPAPAAPSATPTSPISSAVDPATLVDTVRYPVVAVTAEDRATRAEVVAAARAGLAAEGVAVLPGFLRAGALPGLLAECEALDHLAHHSASRRATAYLAAPDPAVPDDHPRARIQPSSVGAVAYDLFPPDAALRALYEWDPLLDFVAELLDLPTLHRYADPFGALNLAVMRDGEALGWHFDFTDFVVSIALQQSDEGGDFVAAPRVRGTDDERYDDVRAVLDGDPRIATVTYPMDPGTLMLFQGRHSLHRVTPVTGSRPRYVALLAYDTKPGTDSTQELKRARYGRLPASA